MINIVIIVNMSIMFEMVDMCGIFNVAKMTIPMSLDFFISTVCNVVQLVLIPSIINIIFLFLLVLV